MASCRSSASAPCAAWAAGLLLALTGCPGVELGDSPSEIGSCNPAGGLAYFQAQIWPSYVTKVFSTVGKACTSAGCHIDRSNVLDFPLPVDYAMSYRRAQGYLNCGMPSESLLLTRPLKGVGMHGGGDLFEIDDPAVQIFLDWFK